MARDALNAAPRGPRRGRDWVEEVGLRNRQRRNRGGCPQALNANLHQRNAKRRFSKAGVFFFSRLADGFIGRDLSIQDHVERIGSVATGTESKSGKTVLITGARAPVALHIARLFRDAGYRTVLADSMRWPISTASSACSTYRRLPPPRFAFQEYGEALAALLLSEDVSLVVPTCEEVFYLAQLWRNEPMQARLFAPAIGLLTQVHDKHAFIGLVRDLGLNAPKTFLLSCPDDLRAVRERSRSLVFKPVWSRFASQVLLRPDVDELSAVRPSPIAPWVAQEYLDGDEISVYAVAVEGVLKAVSPYRSLYRAGKGAGICFEPLVDADIHDFLEKFARGTSWTGQLSLDLIRTRDGRIWPLECNPRTTSGVHFFRQGEVFVPAFLGETGDARVSDKDRQGVRLAMLCYGLPKALRSGTLRRFREDLRSMQEALDWPGDAVSLAAQMKALFEIAATAILDGVSLQQAATRDIEWNGPDQSSI
jgi:hypothetical protein